jgi:uncharacterized protein (DUF427 family)
MAFDKQFPPWHFSTNDLPSLARHLLKNGPRKSSATTRRVRVLFNHTYIVDTTSALHVWEHDAYPQYYVPHTALQHCTFRVEAPVKTADGTVGANILNLRAPDSKRGAGDQQVTDRIVAFENNKEVAGVLAGLVRLEFGSFQWFEEDVPIYVHPKDPHKRIDILPSSRKITVKLDGHTLASATHAFHLHETNLPTRFYLPFSSVDATILRKSDIQTKCPYKGDAEYYHVVVDGTEYRNLVWYYRVPTAESAPIAGSLCFFNEKVDIEIDDVAQDRPKTHFG